MVDQWISGCPEGGCLPSLLTHNPLQTPLVLSNPLWLTTLLSEIEEDLFICVLLSSSSFGLSVWRYLIRPTGLNQM